jgi:flagellar FliL protein
MAEAGEQPQGGAKPAGGKKKLLSIIGGAVLLMAVGGGGAYFLDGGGGDAEAAKKEAASGTEGDHGAEEASIVTLDTFVVNLADDNSQRYLKVQMKVEFFGKETPPRFTSRRPQIRDLLLTLLSSKQVADVRTVEGKQQLRDEIIARISRVIEDDAVKAVYFAEFIVQ